MKIPNIDFGKATPIEYLNDDPINDTDLNIHAGYVGSVNQPVFINEAEKLNLTQAESENAANDAKILVANTNEDWINRKWRPAMSIMYMVVCIFDFIIFPIFWSVLQAYQGQGEVTSQWQPLTLQGAGLFHMAMGAVLGIAAYGRSKEKSKMLEMNINS